FSFAHPCAKNSPKNCSGSFSGSSVSLGSRAQWIDATTTFFFATLSHSGTATFLVRICAGIAPVAARFEHDADSLPTLASDIHVHVSFWSQSKRSARQSTALVWKFFFFPQALVEFGCRACFVGSMVATAIAPL